MKKKETFAILLGLLITVISVSPLFILQRPALVQAPTKTSQIEIINPSVTSSGNITSLAVTQNGSDVAFSIDRKGGGSLWFANGVDYESESLVLRSNGNVTNVEWSHNGQYILYVASSSSSVTLQVVDLSNHNNIKVITLQGIQDPQWSPNDNMIAFSGFNNQGWNLYIANAQTWSTRQITTLGNDEYSSWCSNSSTILFSRSYNGSTSIVADSLKTGTYSTLLNYLGTDIWPIEDANGTLAFESNASGSWTIMTDRNGTMTDLLSTSAHYTGVKSPTVDPQWPLIWASQGKEMFFVGLNFANNEPDPYVINFTGQVLAPSYLGASVDKQLYSMSIYHLAVVSKVMSNSTMPLIATAWNQGDQTLFAIAPGEPLSFVLVQFGPSTGITVHPNPYG